MIVPLQSFSIVSLDLLSTRLVSVSVVWHAERSTNFRPSMRHTCDPYLSLKSFLLSAQHSAPVKIRCPIHSLGQGIYFKQKHRSWLLTWLDVLFSLLILFQHCKLYIYIYIYIYLLQQDFIHPFIVKLLWNKKNSRLFLYCAFIDIRTQNLWLLLLFKFFFFLFEMHRFP